MDYDAYEWEIYQEHEAWKRLHPKMEDQDNPEWYQEIAQEAFWAEVED